MAAAMPTLQRPTSTTEGELPTMEERVNSGNVAGVAGAYGGCWWRSCCGSEVSETLRFLI
ncbi:hypothetical protein V6Z11_A13G181800 [Gossypium hirsutum]